MVSDGEVYVDPKKHLGIDLAGNNSSGIKAPFKLVVRQVGYDDSFGFYIIFEEIYEIPDPIPEPTVPTVKNIVICGQYQPLAGLSIAVPPEILELRVDNPVLHKLDGIWDYVLMDNYYGLPVGTRFGIEEQLNKK